MRRAEFWLLALSGCLHLEPKIAPDVSMSQLLWRKDPLPENIVTNRGQEGKTERKEHKETSIWIKEAAEVRKEIRGEDRFY